MNNPGWKRPSSICSPDQRQVIVLKHLEDMKNQEVAEVMDKTVGSIKALNSRGLANLRKLIDSQGALLNER